MSFLGRCLHLEVVYQFFQWPWYQSSHYHQIPYRHLQFTLLHHHSHQTLGSDLDSACQHFPNLQWERFASSWSPVNQIFSTFLGPCRLRWDPWDCRSARLSCLLYLFLKLYCFHPKLLNSSINLVFVSIFSVCSGKGARVRVALSTQPVPLCISESIELSENPLLQQLFQLVQSSQVQVFWCHLLAQLVFAPTFQLFTNFAHY